MLFIQSFKNIFSFEFPRTFDGFHHFHLRFRKVDTFENKYHRYVDRSVYVTSVLFPLMTFPQIWEIF